MAAAKPGTGCAIAVMAKAPRAGKVKTRLVPPLTPEAAAALSAGFLRDITENIAQAAFLAAIDGYVAYAPAGLETLFDGMLAAGTGLVLADGSVDLPPRVQGFGRCLLHTVQSLLAQGHEAVCLLNSDSPTLPNVLLARAAAALAKPGDRVVLGPADDGGYYLIGMKAAHAHLFEDIAWSTERVAQQTRERARNLGLELIELATWYDVDDRAALQRLLTELETIPADGDLVPYAAPATAACIRHLGLAELLDADAAPPALMTAAQSLPVFIGRNS